MKNNRHKKTFRIDRFARKYYCQHARLSQIRSDKHQAKKLVRSTNKKETEEQLNDEQEVNKE